jgi:hypothetical protein
MAFEFIEGLSMMPKLCSEKTKNKSVFWSSQQQDLESINFFKIFMGRGYEQK